MSLGARLPRFRRATDSLPSFQFTPRDLEILELVAKHRFLRSTHIVGLVAGSRQQILRRLHLLYHHGYLDRPRAQLDYFHAGGSSPLVYGLARRGAGRLRRTLNIPFDKMEWSGKGSKVGRLFLDHALLISDIMVALETACRATATHRLIMAEDMPLPDSMRSGRAPMQWTVSLPSQHKLGVIPDRIFGLEYADGSGMKRRCFFFLEADRGTMPITRPRLTQSSFFRKMLAYEATWAQSIHKMKLGLDRFRVLAVTSSPERAGHLAEAARQIQRGQGLFLFTDAQTMLAAPILFDHRWLTPHPNRTATLAA